MAYINAETVKLIRKSLKARYPKVKFSVRKDGHIAVRVNVMASPYFDQGENKSVNQYWLESHYQGDQLEFLQNVNTIIKTAGQWWDQSDASVDYFHTAFYYTISIGQWDRPHQKV